MTDALKLAEGQCAEFQSRLHRTEAELEAANATIRHLKRELDREREEKAELVMKICAAL